MADWEGGNHPRGNSGPMDIRSVLGVCLSFTQSPLTQFLQHCVFFLSLECVADILVVKNVGANEDHSSLSISEALFFWPICLAAVGIWSPGCEELKSESI